MSEPSHQTAPRTAWHAPHRRTLTPPCLLCGQKDSFCNRSCHLPRSPAPPLPIPVVSVSGPFPKRITCDSVLAKRPDSNLSMLRQPAALAAKKRAEKEDEWEKLQEERAKLAADIEEKEVIFGPDDLVLGIPTI